MPPMPEHSAKGPIFRALDRRYANREARRESLQMLLDRSIPLAEISRRNNVMRRPLEHGELSPRALVRAKASRRVTDAAPGQSPTDLIIDDGEHAIADWFTPRKLNEDGKPVGGWWPESVGNVEEILRQGLITALRLSLPKSMGGVGEETRDIPVDTVWICVGHPPGDDRDPHSTGFECHISFNPRQVSLIILTPGNPNAGHAPETVRPQDVEAFVEDEAGLYVVKSNVYNEVLVKPIEPQHQHRMSSV